MIEVVGQSVIPITMALLVVLSTIGAANGSIFAAARFVLWSHMTHILIGTHHM